MCCASVRILKRLGKKMNLLDLLNKRDKLKAEYEVLAESERQASCCGEFDIDIYRVLTQIEECNNNIADLNGCRDYMRNNDPF